MVTSQTNPLIEEFSSKATVQGARIKEFENLEEASAFIHSYLKELAVYNILISERLKLLLSSLKDISVFKPKTTKEYAIADCGLLIADYAIAETGTLVFLCNDHLERLILSLPRVCISFLKKERIVKDASLIADVISKHLAFSDSSTQVVFVTGPSKTADIECKLCIGVHGPSELLIILTDGKDG